MVQLDFEQLPVERCCSHDLDSHIPGRQAAKSVNKMDEEDENSDFSA
jgi:hypothetical protein